MPKDRRVVVALILAATLVALLVGVAIAQGIGNPSVPSGDVAVVEEAPDGEISQAEFDRALEQAAAQQGIRQVPPPDDPQYAALRDSAMSNVLSKRWLRGEAEERGISVAESEISNRLDTIIQQQFGDDRKQFQQFLKQAHFTQEEAREAAALLVLNEKRYEQAGLVRRSGSQVVPAEASVSDAEIEDYYDANVTQFQQPESRDVRRILNKDQAKVEQAKTLLERDDSPASWKKVAARFSTEDPTKDIGGLVEGVTLGQSEPALEEQIFSAAEGELVGPFKGQSDYYLIQVVSITPAETAPLSEVSEQISQQLGQAQQEQRGQDFEQDYVEKWRSRTFCADDYVTAQCANFTPPRQNLPGAPPVISTPAVPPGRATVFAGQPIPALPQGPISPQTAQPGIIGPPGGALPPGAVPPGGAPAPTP